MRRRVLWTTAAVLVFACAFAGLVLLWPPAPPPFTFLEGKPSFGKPHEVPHSGAPGAPAFQSNWLVQADWEGFMAQADAELRSEGWAVLPEPHSESSRATFYKRGKDSIGFYKDSEPTLVVTYDTVFTGRARPGFIGVTFFQADYQKG